MKIVFTNGLFDLLHRGHLLSLKIAKAQGDFLIVGLNSDESVRKLGRTTHLDQDERKAVLLEMKSVDEVILFDEETPLELIKCIKPDVLVKGNEYTDDQIPGADFVKLNGGIIVKTPTICSSTELRDRIGNSN